MADRDQDCAGVDESEEHSGGRQAVLELECNRIPWADAKPLQTSSHPTPRRCQLLQGHSLCVVARVHRERAMP
jgi:hypothetical protein